MSAEPQIDDEHLRVLESAARGATVDLRYPRSTILSVVARIRALEAEVARKDEALKPFAKESETTVRRHLCLGPDIDHWPIGDNKLTLGHLRAARAALGPWVPTHRGHDGKLVRLLHSGVINAQFTHWRSVIFDDQDGVVFSLYQSEFEHPERVYRGDGEFDRLVPRYLPLTPDEARS